MTLDDLRDYGGMVYVATPYSRYKYGLGCAAYDACRHAEYLVRELGLSAWSPIVHGHQLSLWDKLPPRDHLLWMKINAPLMEASASCVVVKLEGWQDSRGIAEEVAYFQAAGKPVVEMDPLP